MGPGGIRRSWWLVGLLAACSASCALGEGSPRAVRAQPPPSAGPPLGEVREGLSAPLVWRSAPAQAAIGAQGHAKARLTVREVRADGNRLYFDVDHKAIAALKTHDSTNPVLTVRIGECEPRAVRVAGAVWRDWQTPSTVSAALADLPDGELDFTLSAFGLDNNTSFRKQGKTVTALELEDRENYVFYPGDPKTGWPASQGLIEHPCEDEVKP